MTPVLKPIAGCFRTTDMILSLALPDLKDADYRTRVRNGEGPSIAWEVAHMLEYRSTILELFRGKSEQPKETMAGDGEYPDALTSLQLWRQVSADLSVAMEAATEESLALVVGHGAHGEKTALDSITFLTWHEAYHVGALGGIRKALGYPGPAELVVMAQSKG